MEINRRFATRTKIKPRKDGVIKGEISVDLLFIPYTLEKLKDVGMTSENEMLLREIYPTIQRADLGVDMNKGKLRRRLNILNKLGFINKRELKINEKRSRGIHMQGTTYLYKFSKKSDDYLSNYGKFTNPEGRLMKSNKKGVGY